MGYTYNKYSRWHNLVPDSAYITEFHYFNLLCKVLSIFSYILRCHIAEPTRVCNLFHLDSATIAMLSRETKYVTHT